MRSNNVAQQQQQQQLACSAVDQQIALYRARQRIAIDHRPRDLLVASCMSWAPDPCWLLQSPQQEEMKNHMGQKPPRQRIYALRSATANPPAGVSLTVETTKNCARGGCRRRSWGLRYLC
nr:unnamed protein product [Digitaria exilis]